MVGWCVGINFLLLREAFPNVLENFFTARAFLSRKNHHIRRMFAFCAAGLRIPNIKTITERSEKAELINQAHFARKFYITANYRTYRPKLRVRRKPKTLMTPDGF